MQSNGSQDVKDALDHLIIVTGFYAKKIEEKGGGTTEYVMKQIADEIEINGMHGATSMHVVSPMQVKCRWTGCDQMLTAVWLQNTLTRCSRLCPNCWCGCDDHDTIKGTAIKKSFCQ